MVGIVDYGVGNLFSLRSSLVAIGADAFVSSDPEELKKADRILLPGVGAFGDAAEKLRNSGLADFIKEENDYEMVFVVNFFRPLTPDVQSAIEVMREIENACKIKFTAIVNNSNLGNLTTSEDVESTIEKTNELSALTSLPVLFTTATEKVCKDLKVENKFALNLQKKYFDIKEI